MWGSISCADDGRMQRGIILILAQARTSTCCCCFNSSVVHLLRAPGTPAGFPHRAAQEWAWVSGPAVTMAEAALSKSLDDIIAEQRKKSDTRGKVGP